jgi:hypothetical protein
MLYQTVHGKKIISGRISRPHLETFGKAVIGPSYEELIDVDVIITDDSPVLFQDDVLKGFEEYVEVVHDDSEVIAYKIKK